MRSGQIYQKFRLKNGKRVVVLRSLKWEDLDSVLEFANSLVEERSENPDLGIIFDQKQTRESEARWLMNTLSEMEAGNYVNVAAEVDGGKIIGNSHVARGKSSDEKHHGVLGVSVLKEWRGLGIGNGMLKILLDECRKEDFLSVELEVFGNNSRAISLYERLGFEEIGRVPKKIRRHGRFIDSVIMNLEL